MSPQIFKPPCIFGFEPWCSEDNPPIFRPFKPPECKEGEQKCVGYDLYVCENGKWVLKERNSPQCGYTPPPECKEGEQKCVGYDLYVCQNGKWVLAEKDSLKCKPTPPECNEGEKKCVGYDLYQCIGGKWTLIEENSVQCGYKPPSPTPGESIVLTADNLNPQVNEEIHLKAEFYNVKPGSDGIYWYKVVVDGKEVATKGIKPSVTYIAGISLEFSSAGQHTVYIEGMDGCKSNELTINVKQTTCGVKFIVNNPYNRPLYLVAGEHYKKITSSGEVTIALKCDPYYSYKVYVKDESYIVHKSGSVPYGYYTVYSKYVEGDKMHTINIDYSHPPSGGYVNISVVNVPRDVAPYLAAYLEGVMFPRVGGTATSFNLNLHLEPGTWNISVHNTKSREVIFATKVDVVKGKTIYLKYDYNTRKLETSGVKVELMVV